MVLAMTHEEIVAGLAASEVDSYQRLPRLVYQIQTKFRDDARPRAGLIRAREFTMKDAYSLDKDERGLDEQYRTLYKTYFRIFARCGLPAIAVGADVGIMGGSMAHEFMYLTPIGEDTILICDTLRLHRKPPGSKVPQAYPRSRGAETCREDLHARHQHHRDTG